MIILPAEQVMFCQEQSMHILKG